MAVLKVRCPECGASLRQTIEAVEEPTEFAISCPKCKSEFVAEAQPEEETAKKPAKAARKRERDDDDERPRKRKNKDDNSSNKKLLIGGAVGGVVAIGAVVAIVIALSGTKEKPKETAKADPPPLEPRIVQPAMPPGPRQNPNVTSGGPRPNPANSPSRPKIPGDTDALLPKLPDPPIIRIGTSAAVPISTPVERPPAVPPLAPDEDPFIRAKGFRAEGALPPMPKLPPPNQRPLLSLDSGGHTAFVKNVFITPKGDRVITVGEDKAVRLWDSRTGEAVHTIRFPAGVDKEGSLLAAALSNDGQRLAVSGIPLEGLKKAIVPIFLLDVEHGTLVKTISASLSNVHCLDFSPDGKRIAAGYFDGSVQVFDVNTGRSMGKVSAHFGPLREVRFHPTSKNPILGTLGADGAASIWDITAKRKSTLDLAGLGPATICWSHDGSMLAVGGKSGAIMLFGGNGQLIRTLPKRGYKGETVEVLRMKFLPRDREIAFCGIGGTGWAGVISAFDGKTRVEFTRHDNTVMAVNVSADGQRVVSSGGNNHETFVWSTADGKTISHLTGAGKAVWGVGWSKKGKSLAWGTDNKVIDAGHKRLEGTFRLDDLGVGKAPDPSEYNQSIHDDPTVKIEQLDNYELGVEPVGQKPFIFTIPGDFRHKIYAATVLPGRGGKVVVGSSGGLSMIDTRNGGKTIRTFVGHTGHILSVAPSPDGLYFVTGSTDQTVRIWQPELEEPVMSIFLAKSEWIAWTPQGFYACSPHGERLISWQINISTSPATKLPTVLPAERFRPSMYQPAVIKYLVPAGNIQYALAMAQKFDKALVQATNVSDVLPPEVELVSPTGEAGQIDGNTVSVKATAKGTAKQPVTAMKLLVDGRPFQGTSGVRRFDKPAETAEATWEVPVLPGPHSFAVIAESPVSKGMSKAAVVTRSGTPPKPNLYVLSVGVSAYPEGMKLRFAASDARLLAETFKSKSKGVFSEIETRVLTDSAATKKGIQEGLDWLKSKMTAKDVGVVAFSGHGTRDPFGHFYLVPVDISPTDPAGTCFSGDEFKSRLDNMPGRLVAILDACHSGMVAEKSQSVAQTDGLVRDLVADDSGVVVMCASMGREYATESSLAKAGYFTLGLVEGMSGYGDVDQDGVIFIHELDLYARERVKQLSAGSQHPTIGRPASIRPFPIALVEKKP